MSATAPDPGDAGAGRVVFTIGHSNRDFEEVLGEAVPWRCHRRLVTDALQVRGVPVFQIMSVTSARPAEPTPFARVEGGRLTYPPPQDDAR